MGQHPNGQHGAQFQPQPMPWHAYPPPVPPGSNGSFNFAKGFLPIAIVIPLGVALIVGAFQVGGIWSDQQNAIKNVQKDVEQLAAGQALHSGKLNRIEESQTRQEKLLQTLADNPPWHVSVKAATKR